MSPLRPHRKDTAKRLDQRSNPSAASPPRLTIFQHVLYVPEQRDDVKPFLPIWLYFFFSIKQTDPCLTAWAVRPILSGELLRRSKMSHKIRSEEHTSELQSLMRISYAVFCLKKTNMQNITQLST